MTSTRGAARAGPATGRVLGALLLVDAALIGAHVWAGLTHARIPPALNIAMDGSAAEIWGYAKWLAAALLLLSAWRGGRNRLLLASAGAFALVLADDALGLHERLGAALERRRPSAEGAVMSSQDAGELAGFGLMGAAIAAALLWAARRRRQGDAREAAPFVAGLLALGAVAVLLDAVHASISLPWPGPQVLDLVEDGGELVIGSAVAALALARSGARLGEGAAAR